MIEPLLSDDALLNDIKSAKPDSNAFYMWWIGQSGFLIQWNGRHLLLDPYLSESLTTKYAKTDKPHVRMTCRAIDPARLNFVDVVTSSHNHTDHLDAKTLQPLIAASPNVRFVIPEANRAFVCERLGMNPALPAGLNDGTSAVLGAFTLRGIAAAHEKIEQDERGNHKYLGYIVEFGPWTIYHSGDCVPFDGLRESLRRFKIDVVLLPINGAKPERRVAGNFDGTQAAKLAKAIGARVVIPCHYDMFEFNTASPNDEFIPTCRHIGQNFRVLQCGERWSSGELR